MNTKELEVKTVLDSLKPAMEADGGGIELLFVDDTSVYIKFKGACLVCPSMNLTMQYGVIKTFQDKLPWVKTVINSTTKKAYSL